MAIAPSLPMRGQRSASGGGTGVKCATIERNFQFLVALMPWRISDSFSQLCRKLAPSQGGAFLMGGVRQLLISLGCRTRFITRVQSQNCLGLGCDREEYESDNRNISK